MTVYEASRQRIRLGMVGGGDGAFIGAVHRMAARLDGHYELVAGALSSTADKARTSGERLGLASDRIYADYAAMARAEAARPDAIEAVSIVTPNHLHAPVAKAFLEAGIHVICDKPLTTNLEDAHALQALRAASGLVFAVTYNYSFYPLVRRAGEMVRAGDLGAVRLVQVEYPQDWLTEAIENDGQKQAGWRTDPARAGAGCIGDIGTHALQLAEFVSGQRVTELLCDLGTFVPGRRVDDNAHILLRFANGARGMLWASQVAPGNDNNLRIRVYGSKGGLEWRQEDPNRLRWTLHGEPSRILSRAGPQTAVAAGRPDRLPAGHPEGYLEAFATIYCEAADAIRSARDEPSPARRAFELNFLDGVRGVAFVAAALRSMREASWVPLETEI
jgi:predicted dehydrogenase